MYMARPVALLAYKDTHFPTTIAISAIHKLLMKLTCGTSHLHYTLYDEMWFSSQKLYI